MKRQSKTTPDGLVVKIGELRPCPQARIFIPHTIVYHAIILSPLVVVQQMLVAVVVGMISCACKLKTGTENIAKEILFIPFYVASFFSFNLSYILKKLVFDL